MTYKFLSILLLSALPILANSQDLEECASPEDKQSAMECNFYDILAEIGTEHAAAWNYVFAWLMDIEGWQDWWNQPGIDWTAIDIQVLSDAKRVLKDTAYAAINVDGWIQLKNYIENLSLEDIQAIPEQAMHELYEAWNQPIMKKLALIIPYQAKILIYKNSGMRSAVLSMIPRTANPTTNMLMHALVYITIRRTAENTIHHIWNEYVPEMGNIIPELKDPLNSLYTSIKDWSDSCDLDEKTAYYSALLVITYSTTLLLQENALQGNPIVPVAGPAHPNPLP